MTHFPITAKKSLGQHFLADDNIARRIASFVHAEKGDTILEVGAGTGSLTRALQSSDATIIAIDIDQRSVAMLTATIEREGWPNVTCRHADVLRSDPAAFLPPDGGRLFITGNLPYNITSQILFHLFDRHGLVAEAVVMMQREVAERLVARPRTKDYGILSVVTQFHCDVENLMRVSPNVFIPKPRVWSAVVRCVFHDRNAAAMPRYPLFRSIVRESFGKRRKILSNSLAYTLIPDFPAHPELAAWAQRRPEELTLTEFLELTDVVAGILAR